MKSGAVCRVRLVTSLMLLLVAVFANSQTPVGSAASVADSLPPYVRMVPVKADSSHFQLTDSTFYSIAGKTVFVVNRTELNTRDPFVVNLAERILPMANREGLTLSGVMLRGAASPEGPYNNNVRLSVGRAKALRDFMQLHLDSVEWGGQTTHTVAEDYPGLLWEMQLAGDPAAGRVRQIIEREHGNPFAIKQALMAEDGGLLWHRLLRDYYPGLRAARVVLFFRQFRPPLRMEPLMPRYVQPVAPSLAMPQIEMEPLHAVAERRHAVALKSNLIYDLWCWPHYGFAPSPNVQMELYPRRGNFTLNLAFTCPYWHRWSSYRFWQIRHYEIELRRYFHPGQSHTGWYVGAEVMNSIYGIGLGKRRGWEGEGVGGGLTGGYVLPLCHSGRWRLDFSLGLGAWVTRYDPYIYGNPHTGEEDGKYYYHWHGWAKDFRRRNHQLTWLGPTQVGITLATDVLFWRRSQPGVSFRRKEALW